MAEEEIESDEWTQSKGCGSVEEFLGKLDLKVYENEEEYWFQFNDVIESLTKVYL